MVSWDESGRIMSLECVLELLLSSGLSMVNNIMPNNVLNKLICFLCVRAVRPGYTFFSNCCPTLRTVVRGTALALLYKGLKFCRFIIRLPIF